MRPTFLPFSPPMIGEEEIAEVVDTLRSDWITTGPKTQRFEREFAEYVGAPTGLAVHSCTAALRIALAALHIGPGDAVITTPMTFCSGVHVIVQAGATPILVDVEPDTLNISPVEVEKAIVLSRGLQGSARIRAILPVHLYGHPCDMNALLALAHRYGLAVVEDAAHALPASYRGSRIGTLAATEGVPRLTAFSFYATKNLTTGEGGMLTGAAPLIDEARAWSLHGMSRDAWKRYGKEGSWFYEVVLPGFKENMTDIQAALGLHQLRRLPDFHTRRQELADRYNQAFAPIPELELPACRAGVEHAWHLYVLRLNAVHARCNRDWLIGELQRRNIATSVHFIPVHMHPYYRDAYGWRPDDFPVAHAAYRRMLSLPLSPRMSNQDADDVIAAVTEVMQSRRGAAAGSVAGSNA